jgi:hypothetical protein
VPQLVTKIDESMIGPLILAHKPHHNSLHSNKISYFIRNNVESTRKTTTSPNRALFGPHFANASPGHPTQQLQPRRQFHQKDLTTLQVGTPANLVIFVLSHDERRRFQVQTVAASRG